MLTIIKCLNCQQLAYTDGGRKKEGYAFCKIKCSWVTLTSNCWEVKLCNHQHFKDNPKEINKIYQDWHNFQMENDVEYDYPLIMTNLKKNFWVCDGCNLKYSKRHSINCDVSKNPPPESCPYRLWMARIQGLIKHHLRYESFDDSITIDKLPFPRSDEIIVEFVEEIKINDK